MEKKVCGILSEEELKNLLKMEIAAIKRLNNNQVDNNISKYPTSNLISMKESDASKIVDHFFTQNLKHN